MRLLVGVLLILPTLACGVAELAAFRSSGAHNPLADKQRPPPRQPAASTSVTMVPAGERALLQEKSAASCGAGYASSCQVGLGQICEVHTRGCQSTGVQLYGKQCCCCPIGGMAVDSPD